MGDDDDAGCLHRFALIEVHLTLGASGAGYACTRCGTPAYSDLTPPATRPKL